MGWHVVGFVTQLGTSRPTFSSNFNVKLLMCMIYSGRRGDAGIFTSEVRRLGGAKIGCVVAHGESFATFAKVGGIRSARSDSANYAV